MRASLRSFTCLEYAPPLFPRGRQQSLLDFASALAHHLQIPAERAAPRPFLPLTYPARTPSKCVQGQVFGSQAVKGIAENESNSGAISRRVVGSSSALPLELRSAPGIGCSIDPNCPSDGPDRLERGKVKKEQTRLRHRYRFRNACSGSCPRFAGCCRKTAGCSPKARHVSACPDRCSRSQRHDGLGEYGVRHLSQARQPLLRQDQAGQVHDGGGCH
jgi:hypothetical protein